MLRVDWTSRVEEPLYRELIKEQILFNLTLVTGRQLRNVSVTKFSGEERKVFVSGEVFSLSDIVSLDFTGKESVRFFQKILQKLPQSVRFRRLEGKDIYLYPYNASAEKWNLVKTYPYQFLLYRKKVVKLPGGKVKNYHHYQLRYKLYLSAFSPVVLYPDNLISKGTPTVPHKPGSWREGCKELIGYIKEEFEMRKKRELLITLALKDGREITGIMKKYDGYRGMEFYLMDPSNKKNKIIVFKHAVEDFWVEE